MRYQLRQVGRATSLSGGRNCDRQGVGDGVGLGTILDDDEEPGGGSEVEGAGVSRTGLPFTGAPTLVLLSASALLLGLGTALVLWRRRHEAAMA